MQRNTTAPKNHGNQKIWATPLLWWLLFLNSSSHGWDSCFGFADKGEAAGSLQPGACLLAEPRIISELWEVLHCLSSAFPLTTFNQNLQLSLTHSQYLHPCISTLGRSFFSVIPNNMRYLDTDPFFFFFSRSILHSFPYNLFSLCPLKKNRWNAIKQKQSNSLL